MAFKTFIFLADTVDGKILEFPKVYYLRCDQVQPLGCDIIRQYTKTQCILAKKVFLIYYQGQVFGSTQFTGVQQFVQYVNNVCTFFCIPSLITINNCNLTRYGCNVTIYNTCAGGYTFTRFGCTVTRNGCDVILN